MTATPRFHTPRNPARRSLGPKLGKLAAALGMPLMPWQQMAADVALEIDPATGRFAYKRVVITVPRQAGKTTMTLMLGLHRLLTTENGKIWYTAQTGQAARERFIGDLVPPATKLLGHAVTVKRGAGDTRMSFPAIGSQMRPHPPNDEYLHGEQSDLNLVDEPWAYTEIQGDALVQAFLPTQNTRPNAQTVYLSTMGTADSKWWHDIVDDARAGVPGTCVCDWGLPEAADPSDVDAVIAAHPAVGHTIDGDVIREAHAQMKPAEFARAYANIRTATRSAVFTAETLKRVISRDATMTAGSSVALGAAVSWDRSRSVIAAAGHAADGTPVVEIIDARPGSGWVPARLRDLRDTHTPLAVMVDARSPASTVATDPTVEDVITVPDSRAVAGGTGSFLDRISAGTIRLSWDAELAAAFDVLTLRVVGDLGQMIDRKHSAGSVAHIEAAMLALTGLEQAPAPAPAPMIWSITSD